ncbi:hypothetical protein [Yinghuangia soli]|uniref:Uncharacterized protein n=1 Tax=Yinghuangia soli TaxID=2908204 RepID=A0AA41Q660_9ACTN|nr:hypothetical protein [Yinghuangia soli]MCF2531695.1 hypothetical protein [Yinghuangia soli]
MTDRLGGRLADAGRLPDDYVADADPLVRVMAGVRRRRRRNRLRAAAATGLAAALAVAALTVPRPWSGGGDGDVTVPVPAPETPGSPRPATPAPPGAISGTASFGPWWVGASECRERDPGDPLSERRLIAWPPVGAVPTGEEVPPEQDRWKANVRCLLAHANTSRGDITFFEDPALPLTFADGTAFTGYRPTPDQGEFVLYGIAPAGAAKAEIRVDDAVVATADTAAAPEAAGMNFFALLLDAPAGASVTVQGFAANGAPVGRARTQDVMPGTFPGVGDPKAEAAAWAEEQEQERQIADVPVCPETLPGPRTCRVPGRLGMIDRPLGSEGITRADAEAILASPDDFGARGSRSQAIEGDHGFGRLA